MHLQKSLHSETTHKAKARFTINAMDPSFIDDVSEDLGRLLQEIQEELKRSL